MRNAVLFESDFNHNVFTHVYKSSCEMPYYLNQILTIIQLPKQIIVDNPRIKSNGNPSIRNQAVPCGKTDRRDVAGIRVSRLFWESDSIVV